MNITKKTVKSLIRTHNVIDSWFPFRYSLDIYSGCEYDCLFCPANSCASKKIIIKENALTVLKTELSMLKGQHIIGIGGGINDSYQAVEQEYRVTRRVVEMLMERGHRPFIMTRSAHILDDIPLYSRFPEKVRPFVAFSIPQGDALSLEALEPGLPTLDQRFRVLKKLNKVVETAVSISPLIPFFNDHDIDFDIILSQISNCGTSFFLANYIYPDTIKSIKSLFEENSYYKLEKLFSDEQSHKKYLKERLISLMKRGEKYNLVPFIPIDGFIPFLSLRDQVIVRLMTIYNIKLFQGIKRDSYKKAAYGLNLINNKKFLDLLANKKLTSISGIGPFVEKVVTDIAVEKNLELYEKLVGEYKGTSRKL